jgi:hypothetical protein
MTELELLDRERRATERPYPDNASTQTSWKYPASEVPCHREPERFDFLAMPTLNKAMVLELARCEFLLRKENMLLLELHRAGPRLVCLSVRPSCPLHHRLDPGHRVDRSSKRDELGFVPLSKTGAEPLFEMLSQRQRCTPHSCHPITTSEALTQLSRRRFSREREATQLVRCAHFCAHAPSKLIVMEPNG